MKRILNIETTKYIDKKVKICGWVNTVRSHGKIIFIDLRDRGGLVQIVFTPTDKDLYGIAQELKPEWVIEIVGKVQKRPKGTENPDLETGNIEIGAEKLKVLARSKTIPFPIDTDGYKIEEGTRLKYRYLDLRRKRLKTNLKIRQEVIQFIRDFLQKRDFIEIETPILTKSTPEGARDFVVPSRLQPGKFYALPQSPQQYKQLLMLAGLERYFQIARCFRDEDPRADRAYGEFTQLDLEMSFVDQKDILDLTEMLFASLVKKIFPKKKITKTPFPRISYKEAMDKYGTDRPDLRKNPVKLAGARHGAGKKDPDELAFCFIVDWPLFEKTPQKEITSSHHPFTAPKDEDIGLFDSEPMKIRSWQHDFVLNGFEIGGGSIRITDPKIQEKVFEILGHSKKEIKQKFGHLLEAFEYGVPPHGGIAPGIDRFLFVALGEPSLRETIAFPMVASGKTAVVNAPSRISKKQLEELYLKIAKPKK
jgi:aspartyl-tRNA synthetase